MQKKVLITMPNSVLEKVNFLAHDESRTRSDLIRQALREYEDRWKQRNPGKEIVPMPLIKYPE